MGEEAEQLGAGATVGATKAVPTAEEELAAASWAVEASAAGGQAVVEWVGVVLVGGGLGAAASGVVV